MKKWITLLTCAAFTLSSLNADDAPPVDSMEVPPELADDDDVTVPDTGRKQVGRAANDGSKTGQSAQKYVLAASIIALGITALILVSKNQGHRHHHHKHK